MTAGVKGLAAILVTSVVWGFSFLSTKKSLEFYSPIGIAVLRNGLAALCLLPLYCASRNNAGRKNASRSGLTARDILLLALAGLSGVSFYFVFENNGLASITASEASIVVGTIPILVLGTEWLYGKFQPAGAARARAKKCQWLGAGISIAGIALVSGGGVTGSGTLGGYLFMAASALCWVAYCFLTRGLFARCSYIAIVFWQTLFGFVGLLPFALPEMLAAPPPRVLTLPPVDILLHVVFLALGCSALCYVLYVYALKALGAAVSAIFINLIPAVTVVAGFFLMGDRLSAVQWLGAALSMLGVYLAVLEKPASRAVADECTR